MKNKGWFIMSKMTNETNLCKDYTFDNFNVNEDNKFAYNISLAVAEKPDTMYNPLFISSNDKDRIHLIHTIGNYVIEHFNYRVFLYNSRRIYR